MKSKRICFVQTHIPDPRTNKRIKLVKEDLDVYVVCARRKDQNIWEPAFDDIDYSIFDIDLPGIKHPIKRFFLSKKYQKAAFKKMMAIEPDIVYAGGLDSLQIVAKYKKRCKKKEVRVIFEVADLRECFIEEPTAFKDRIIKSYILKLEKKLFKSVDALVLTSHKFYDIHYEKLISEGKVFFMPNTPEKKAFINYKKKSGGAFTIGFIGGIRYLTQMKLLVDASTIVGCKVLFAGAGGTSTDYSQIVEYCKGKKNVEFYGKYNYDADIAKLYGMVDCVYAVYDADNPNVRIALPNKLYESIICDLPIIVAKGTYLEERVKAFNVGFSVSHTSAEDLISVLTDLMSKKISVANESFEKAKKDIDIDRYNSKLKQIIENY